MQRELALIRIGIPCKLERTFRPARSASNFSASLNNADSGAVLMTALR